jgi:VanZ family protein
MRFKAAAYIHPEDIRAGPFEVQRAGKRLVKRANRDNRAMPITARDVWPIAAWITCVLLISLLPLPLKDSLKTHGRFHNGAHFCAFLITVLLVCRGRSNASITASVAGAIGLAFFIEGAQTAIYHNDFEWSDVLIDSLGAAAGGLLLLAYRAEVNRRMKI